MADRFNIEDLGFPELLKIFDELKKKINESAETMTGAAKKMKDEGDKYNKSVTDIDSRINKLTRTIIDLKNKQGELGRQLKNGKITQNAYNREMAETSHAINRANNDRKKYINVIQSEIGSIKRAKAENAIWRRERNELGKSTNKNKKQLEKYNKSINKNTALIKKNIDAQSRSFMSANKLAGAFRSIAMAMGVSLGIYGIFRVLKNAVGIMARFEAAMSKVKAVTGATADEIKRLERDAMRLGATTPKTAEEVANLQYEFAKLGFTTQEILNATEATIQLSIAAGSDLAQAAEVAGATIRGFGLKASETQRVVDVMANSFSSSALNLERFAEAMKYVAPIGKIANITIEEMTAMLSKMADAGIHGSMAGTSLRMIISQLDKTGRGTAQSIKDLAEKGLTLADAQQEVGQRAKTALLVLADQTEQIEKLKIQYDEAAGSAQKMADIMQDNLTYEVIKLKSAWEGFVLTGRKANGVMRSIVRGLRAMLDTFTPLDKELEKMQMYDEHLAKIKDTIIGLEDEAARAEIVKYIQGLAILRKLYAEEIDKSSGKIKKGLIAQRDGLIELEEYLNLILGDTKELKKLTFVETKIISEEDVKEVKEIIGIINNLNARIADYTKKKNEATNPAYIAFYNKEIKRLQEQVKWYENLDDSLDKLEPKIATIAQDIDKAAGEITATLKYEPPKESIFRKFFRRLFGLTDRQKDEIKDAARTLFNEMRDMLTGFNQQLIDLAEKRVSASEDTLNDLRDLLKQEQALKDEGKANDVVRLQTQIAEENKIRAKAQSDLEKFNKTQKLLNTAQEISSLVTASANIIKGFSHIPIIGTALGIAAVVAMLGSYAALKAKIGKMSKGYAEGTEYVERGNNPRGKDTIHARLNEGERVISTEDNKKLGNLTNKELIEELQYWNYYKNRTPGVTPRDMTGELIGQLKRQERLQRDTLDFMKSDAKIIELSNGKILVKKDNSIEIISYNA